MMRHCDGTDPNLVRIVHDDYEIQVHESYTGPIRVSPRHEEPCDCGLQFDDVQRSVIYPHAHVIVNPVTLAELATQLERVHADLDESMRPPFVKPGQCQECGSYNITGKPPVLHRDTCESSGTAQHYRHMMNPWGEPEDPRYVARLRLSLEYGETPHDNA